RFDRGFARKLSADRLAHLVDRLPFGDRVRTREIDVFEDARPRSNLLEGPEGPDTRCVDEDQFARLDIAKEGGSDHVESDRFRSKDRRLAELAHDQGTNAE